MPVGEGFPLRDERDEAWVGFGVDVGGVAVEGPAAGFKAGEAAFHVCGAGDEQALVGTVSQRVEHGGAEGGILTGVAGMLLKDEVAVVDAEVAQVAFLGVGVAVAVAIHTDCGIARDHYSLDGTCLI